MRKTNTQVQGQTTSSKAKTAGIFIGGFASGGLLGAVGMHLYHKKKALDEMEKVITNNDVPLNDSDDIEQKNSDFCEVPEEPKHQEPIEPGQTVQESEHVPEEVPEEYQEPTHGYVQETEESEVQEEIKEESDIYEISECIDGEKNYEETSKSGDESDIEVSEQTNMQTENKNQIIQKMVMIMNGSETYPGLNNPENIYGVIANSMRLLMDHPSEMSIGDRASIQKIFDNEEDADAWSILLYLYDFYNDNYIELDTVKYILEEYDHIRTSIKNYPVEEFTNSMIRFALDVFQYMHRENAYSIAFPIEDMIILIEFVLNTDAITTSDYERIIDDIETLASMIYNNKEQITDVIRCRFYNIIELSGIRYTDKYYDDMYPLLMGQSASLPLFINDYNTIVKDKNVKEYAEKNSSDSVQLLRRFNVNMALIQSMIDDGKFGEAKETYRDLILPITKDTVIVKMYPEIQTIIRNIGDRITDIIIEEKKKTAQKSSIEEEEVKTNTGKTYPAKSKSKNRRRNNGRRK